MKATPATELLPVIQFTRGGLLVFITALVLIPASLLCGLIHWRDDWLAKRPAPEPPPSVVAEVKAPSTDRLPKQVGPWGELRVLDLLMAPPMEFTAKRKEISPDRETVWIFAGQGIEQVKDTLARCGLDQHQIELATSHAQPHSPSHGLMIQPSDELLFSMSPTVRSQLYAELAHVDANVLMVWPFLFPRMGLDKNLAGESFSPAVETALHRLVYVRGDTQMFSDLAPVLKLCRDDTERTRLVNALSRRPALLAGLHISPDADVVALAKYWAMGRDVAAVRSFFESLQRLPDGGDVSLSFLVPEFARNRVYTFPTPGPADPMMDCQWTAFNFFNEIPDSQLNNPDYLRTRLLHDCRPLDQAALPGDLLVFVDEKGNWFHSCVYIAGDIVFTKNGDNEDKPWKFMHLQDVKTIYSLGGQEPQIHAYRLNGK